jgi:hypothetical protein
LRQELVQAQVLLHQFQVFQQWVEGHLAVVVVETGGSTEAKQESQAVK